MMKKDTIYIISLFIAGLTIFSSCTGNFEEYNTKTTGYGEDKQIQDFKLYTNPIDIVEQGIYFNYDWGSGKNWPYQIMQNLSSDMFCGYFHDFNGSFNDKNATYNLNDGLTSTTWINTYGYILPAAQKAIDLNKDLYPAFVGVTKILKVELMHRIADLYGPIVYTQFGIKTGSDPDDLKTAYYAFFSDLDDAQQLINDYIKSAPNNNTFADADILTQGGTYPEWIKFSNSLRLRLAMRISNVDRTKAEYEAKKALDPNNGGVLELSSEIIQVSGKNGYTNPLGEINKGWLEVHMNANMESYLLGYEDPRTQKYFEKSIEAYENEIDDNGNYVYGETRKDVNYYGQYKGIRQGTGTTHNYYKGHSISTVTPNTPAILMTAAEVWFLRAEAALRGYVDAGKEGEYYKKGVQTSFEQWGAGSADLYLESQNTPAGYKDAFGKENNPTIYDIAAQSNVTPKWEDAVAQEEKLEKIAVQKWLAIYPEGCEAWAEQRRTGYPKLFEVYHNNSQGTIDSKTGIRRLIFPQALKNDNPTQYNQLLRLLGGADNGGTRLWWDVGRNIF